MEWDPWLIMSQMVCLQCLYYLGLGLFMVLLVGTRVPSLTLLYLFDFATLTPRTTTGWCAIAAFLHRHRDFPSRGLSSSKQDEKVVIAPRCPL
ncbi:protein SYS1 [Hordeum vulgare]|nr:protein SYS1 [Hordeum vulgare]